MYVTESTSLPPRTFPSRIFFYQSTRKISEKWLHRVINSKGVKVKNNIKNLWNEQKSVDEAKKEFFSISENIADIISKIVIERNKLNISQRDLAKMTGLKQSAIARLESLAVMPRIDTLVKVCFHLNLKFELSKKN